MENATIIAFKNAYLSYSRLRRFEECPRAFELHYVRKVTSVPNQPMLFGRLVHKVLEDYSRKQWELHYRGPVDFDDLRNLLKTRWNDAGLTSLETVEDAIKILRDFSATSPPFDPGRILGVDKAKVDALLKELGKTEPRAEVGLLKVKLEALAEKSVSPRLYAPNLPVSS